MQKSYFPDRIGRQKSSMQSRQPIMLLFFFPVLRSTKMDLSKKSFDLQRTLLLRNLKARYSSSHYGWTIARCRAVCKFTNGQTTLVKSRSERIIDYWNL